MKLGNPLLIELHFLPSIWYFALLLKHPAVYLEQHENYGKRSFRNRTYIATSNGRLRLTIPLEKGKNQQQPVRQVRISYDEPWQKQHWSAIQSAYGRAPFYEFYAEDLKAVLHQKETLLFDYNLKILKWLLNTIGANPRLEFSPSFLSAEQEGMEDARNRIHPRWKKGQPTPGFRVMEYRQVFQEKTGFLANMSMLDLIFCKGPETIIFLKKSIS